MPFRSVLLRACAVVTLVAALAAPVVAQTPAGGPALRLGTDLVSRYVWRGLRFGDSPSVQPKVTFATGGLEVGAWGNYAVSTDEANAAETDFWLGYTLPTKAGTFAASLVDYFYPGPGSAFFDWQGGGQGSHTVEAGLRYTVPRVPLYAAVSYNVHNDPDGSFYAEAGYTTALQGVELGAALGAVAGRSAWYGVAEDGWALTNVSLRFARTVGITEHFSLPLQAQLVLNPHTEQTYLVFGVSL